MNPYFFCACKSTYKYSHLLDCVPCLPSHWTGSLLEELMEDVAETVNDGEKTKFKAVMEAAGSP